VSRGPCIHVAEPRSRSSHVPPMGRPQRLRRCRVDDATRPMMASGRACRKASKASQKLPHWQAAVEALIVAAEGRGPLLHARVGMLRAMNHGRERIYSDRKETHWGKRKLKRDG
jgi:hypothetical protein